MNSLVLAAIAFAGYVLAYRLYGRYLARRVFAINPEAITPAHEFRDDRDFVPTRRAIVFGHHFASIAGTGPIVGPAIGVIWGWLPAFLWVLLGPIFVGAVHDFGAIVVSARNQGRTIGDTTGQIISPRARLMFLILIFFLLLMVIAIFAMIMGVLFTMYPESVFAVWGQIPIAVALGYVLKRTNIPAFPASVVGVLLLYLLIEAGVLLPLKMPSLFGVDPITLWVIVLLVYCYIASVLPVWRLLQPRDYINGHMLFVAMGALVLGMIVLHPPVSAPVLNLHPEGAPSLIPALFIIIACGAISGFHSLVSSGTTSKQIASETDAQPIGYGGMLLEGALAVIVLVCVAAAIGDANVWHQHYTGWKSTGGLAANLNAVVTGAANMLGAIGVPRVLATTAMGVFIAAFTGTTLDTATRLQRYVITELASTVRFRPLTTTHGATSVAVLSAAALALAQSGGKGGLMLWPLFGASNQLLGGLALLVTTVYLVRQGRNSLVTGIPMVFMLLMTGWAMIENFLDFWETGQWHLVIINAVILVLDAWMIVEAVAVLRRSGKEKAPEHEPVAVVS